MKEDMRDKAIGFIGGGRITRVILEGFKRKRQGFKKVVVSDINPEALRLLNGICRKESDFEKDASDV